MDVLNVLHLVNKAFIERAKIVFNPRNNFYVSKIDGKLNKDMVVNRDTIINANTFMYLGRDTYNEDRMKKIKAIKERQKAFFLDDTVFEKMQ